MSNEHYSQPNVSSVIAGSFTNWKPGDIVFISGPTGSGKSTFVFETLLDWIISTSFNGAPKGPILYLVNRRALKTQFEDILKTEISAKLGAKYPAMQLNQFITIRTYQSIETELKRGNIQQLSADLCKYKYIVYDECHYFYTDSTHNPATILSYTFLLQKLELAIHVFMSATIDEFWRYFDLNNFVNNTQDTIIKQYRQLHYKNFIHEYSISGNYDYINLHSIDGIEDIPALIGNSPNNSKWLIFIDSKKNGKRLLNAILDTEIINEDGIVFLDAEYEKDEGANESIKELNQTRQIKKRIVISTAVLDNGVSFHDINLRNIVIFSDMNDMFIQMLGRKRKDSKAVDLYICKRKTSYFEKRRNSVDKTIQYLSNCEPHINAIHQTPNQIRYDLQQFVFDSILGNENTRYQLNKFCYIACGSIYLNPLSKTRLSIMRNFYDDMYKAMTKNENAFLEKQAEWLGYDKSEITAFVDQDKVENRQKHLSALIEVLDGYVGQDPFDAAENKIFKSKISTHLLALLKLDLALSEDELLSQITSADISDLGSLTEIISDRRFNKYMNRLRLPYRMDRPSKKKPVTYQITKIELEDNS